MLLSINYGGATLQTCTFTFLICCNLLLAGCLDVVVFFLFVKMTPDTVKFVAEPASIKKGTP
jgi:hypothetical protein